MTEEYIKYILEILRFNRNKNMLFTIVQKCEMGRFYKICATLLH